MNKPKDVIPLFKVFMSEDVLKPVSDLLMSGFIGQGEQVEKFETLLKNYFGNYLVATTNAATSAEHLAIRMLKEPSENVNIFQGVGFSKNKWPGIQDGDEVLATPQTCFATTVPILANGMKIKWVDVDPDTCNMDLIDLERKITAKTKIILPVHWGGYPNDLDKIKEIQTRSEKIFGFKPAVIEDCAHSFGSTYKGKKIGNHGNMCFFSFQAIKHLTTGDGGALVLPHKELYNSTKLLRWFGIDRETNSKNFRCEDDIKSWGYKFHMNDINATIGIHNFAHIDEITQKHQANAEFYNNELKNVDGVTLLENKDDRKSAYWIYTIKVDRRDDFVNYMKECNIMVSKVHERNDKHSCVKEFKVNLPNLDKLSEVMISIPNGWWITEEERQYIVDCIKKGW